jgi:two-component system, cell cycle sensor histidine kinase and response regulator CckA
MATEPDQKAWFSKWIGILAVALALAVLAGGIWFYQSESNRGRQTVERDLSTVASLKIGQIANWRAERVGDAQAIASNTFFAEAVTAWLAKRDAATEDAILAWFQGLESSYHYSNVQLIGTDGQVLLAADESHAPLAADALASLRTSMQEGEAALTELHLASDGSTIEMDAIAPVRFAGTPVGAVLLSSNASEFLYPLIQAWPMPSNSAETLLVRRDGNDVLYLNELRMQGDTALKLRMPLTRAELPAVQAILGKTGIFVGKDYRGEQVIAALAAVPYSSWFVVSKMDTSEAFASLQTRLGLELGLICLLVVALLGGVGFVYQRGQKQRYRDAYQAKAEREAVLARYEHLMRRANDAILLASEDLHILEANDRASEMYGYSGDEFRTLSLSDLMPPEKQGFEQRIQDLAEKGSFVAEAVNVRKDGSRFTASISSSIIAFNSTRHIHSIIRDVTEAKKAEEAMSASEVRYRRLFEAAQDGILILDADTGRVLDANPFLEQMLGYTHEQIVGKAIWDLGAFKDAVANKDKFEELQLNNYVRYENLPLQHADGRLVEVEFVSNSYAANHEKVIQCNIRDITERRRAEAALREREEQLRQSQKLEAVGQLAGGIAHDFNNLLTVIMGDCELLLADRATDDPSRDTVQEILGISQRAAKLTAQILAFSRRQTMQPQVICLNEALRSMESLLQRTLGERTELAFWLDPSLGLAEVDPHQLEQVLLNLALNARDAMPAGGRLTIESANVDLDEAYCLSHPEVQPGSYVVLAVSDTGSGIAPEVLPHVFEPFFTTKQPGLGTGLGLSMVFGVTKQSSGSVSVYSEPGTGTTFKIYLPRVESALSPEACEDDVTSPRAQVAASETMLLVEDEFAVRSLVVRILSREGYTVVTAADGDEALRVCLDETQNFDLVLTDVVLPGMQGRELAERLLASHPHLKVLYMSGYTRNAIAHSGRLDEGINFLEKPFTAEALVRKVREVLDQQS